MRVLIVDDDEIVRMMLNEALTGAGYEVIAAHDGREALEAIRQQGCRIVISDWQMPRMTGIELCHAVRREDTGGYVYFILLTSHNSVPERIKGLRAGADDFVAKPFEPSEMVARVGSGVRVLSMETRDVAIFAMAKLAESRDHETGTHLERVRLFSRLLTQHLAGLLQHRDVITPEFVHLIYLTSPLHDIGKVGIPDCVLLKPGRLSDREFEIMKTHTTLGAQTLDAALRQFPGARYLEMGRDIAATHHERFDGTGYPKGLAGDSIPLCGRIVALADVYDALTSKRVYKPAFAHDVARSMIIAESGAHFDPTIVEAFIETEEQFIEIRERFKDAQAMAA
jgi:putative two-component system response regulator